MQYNKGQKWDVILKKKNHWIKTCVYILLQVVKCYRNSAFWKALHSSSWCSFYSLTFETDPTRHIQSYNCLSRDSRIRRPHNRCICCKKVFQSFSPQGHQFFLRKILPILNICITISINVSVARGQAINVKEEIEMASAALKRKAVKFNSEFIIIFLALKRPIFLLIFCLPSIWLFFQVFKSRH